MNGLSIKNRALIWEIEVYFIRHSEKEGFVFPEFTVKPSPVTYTWTNRAECENWLNSIPPSKEDGLVILKSVTFTSIINAYLLLYYAKDGFITPKFKKENGKEIGYWHNRYECEAWIDSLDDLNNGNSGGIPSCVKLPEVEEYIMTYGYKKGFVMPIIEKSEDGTCFTWGNREECMRWASGATLAKHQIKSAEYEVKPAPENTEGFAEVVQNNKEEIMALAGEEKVHIIQPNAHYLNMEMQPFEVIQGILDVLELRVTPMEGFYIGNVIKYAMRQGRKADTDDVAKARHYMELLKGLSDE